MMTGSSHPKEAASIQPRRHQAIGTMILPSKHGTLLGLAERSRVSLLQDRLETLANLQVSSRRHLSFLIEFAPGRAGPFCTSYKRGRRYGYDAHSQHYRSVSLPDSAWKE